MPVIDPISVARRFIDPINAHDVDGLCALMTDDHRFIDSVGEQIIGVELMRAAWRSYFRWFPDYAVMVSETFVRESTVVIVGRVRGTYAVNGRLIPENAWDIPAAWRAVLRDGRVAEWQVYADNEPVRQIMGRTEQSLRDR